MSTTAELARRWVSAALVLAITSACGDDTRTPVGPSGRAAGTVTGLVRGERPPASRIARPHPPLVDAAVTVMTGAAVGRMTRTRDDGSFELSIPSGAFKLRFSHPAFEPSESTEMIMMPKGQIAVPEIALRTAPWTLAGLVTDSRGNPVPDAEVTIRPGDAFFSVYGTARTDAAGRYRFTSARPHWDHLVVSATRSGFEPVNEQRVPCCDVNGDATHDIRMVRVVSITPTAPSVLRVGQSVPVPASVVTFDNGTTRNIFVLPTSAAPSVVAVNPGASWYDMRGVSIGIAVLTFDLFGTTATLQVRVLP